MNLNLMCKDELAMPLSCQTDSVQADALDQEETLL